jgi:hypothetical protein
MLITAMSACSLQACSLSCSRWQQLVAGPSSTC